MFLESRINEKLTILVDAETVGGLDKSQLNVNADPDHILDNAMAVMAVCAEKMGAALSTAGSKAPVTMEIKFGIKVDSNAIVSISRNTSEAQFHVTFRWDA